MGLFDIFKRRSKKAKEKKAREQAAEKEETKQSNADQTESELSEKHDSEVPSSAESKSQSDTDNLAQSKTVVSSTVSSSESAGSSSKESEVPESAESNHDEEKIDSASETSVNSTHPIASESSENVAHHSTENIKSSSSSSVESSTVTSESYEESKSSSTTSSESSSKSTEVSEKSKEAPVSDASEDEKPQDSNEALVSDASEDEKPQDSKEAPVSDASEDEKPQDSKEAPVSDASEDEKSQKSKETSEQTKDNNEDKDTEKYEHGLAKSRSSFGKKLNELFANFRSVDDDFFDNLEDTLIESDVGFDMAIKLTDQLRDEVKLKNVKKAKEVQNVVVEKLIQLYDDAGDSDVKIHFADKGPTVILFVGVNGVGKTTTIGKMANQYHQAGKKVLLAAADTFRAGAIQQLDVWAKRAHVDIVKKPEGSDPASVVYEATQKAKAENYDILFVDTAGRLQNKVNLMNELSKMKKVLTREIPSAPHEVLLVLDATTGQNALNQAKLFKDTTDVTGIVLTKLDGSARGGIILAIRSELHIPVKLVGLGEQINDLRPFDANDYVYGLFKGLLK